ncbi:MULTISPECIES: Txe/YoeB family addiction module toxin [Aerococcus]|uniref:Endoribonuclease YoeB n=1 Tax=Aerococcus sanguinicola TaxID=119206 RepID=A0A5N1GDH8_9LACT|nr:MULTISPECIES: Txe/YoeB family addiction module toxin [Aerococcus]KAA9298995.1 Txe/YoeB family addiction module toxin [Aerococcus sanguinicola]MDK6370214.1 Txe/YoeB family addiction module toxin [Aerococcus sp. UMB9870]MDK6680782.1 Txe/YoeB family addiction module toxin [Aerococcus sp. UMB8608]MDK6686222.1 Txe/YoeB family addiction module toxin [Aerococcus sp. UMB8623]MDK6939947.1 Txe/YoeB family addiction module toxin [Aerococcus sp. UMB8487]
MKVHWSRRSVIERDDWKENDRKVYDKIYRLLQVIKEDPYQGLGKPEPLKYDLSDYWSRRLTRQDRLVYRVTDDAIEVLSCKYHY